MTHTSIAVRSYLRSSSLFDDSIGMKNGANAVFAKIEPFITHLLKPLGFCKSIAEAIRG